VSRSGCRGLGFRRRWRRGLAPVALALKLGLQLAYGFDVGESLLGRPAGPFQLNEGFYMRHALALKLGLQLGDTGLGLRQLLHQRIGTGKHVFKP
jgi:hypothetical protein